MTEIECWVTGEKAQQEEFHQTGDLTKITSDACGIYWITERALQMLEKRKEKIPN